MRLALSSAAAPAAPLGELLEAAARRGLGAIELVEGHGHALDPALLGTDDAVDAARRARAAGIAIAAFRLADAAPGSAREADSARDASSARNADLRCLIAFARALDAPILVPLPDDAGALSVLRGEGLRAMAVLRSDTGRPGLIQALDRLDPAVPVAWEADPSAGQLAERGSALLARAGDRLGHIVLRGGGPEATEQEGRGVGSLMTRLAVAGYGGTVSLAPSSERYRVIWDAWLGRRGGWGCGSRSEDRSLVTLGRDA